MWSRNKINSVLATIYFISAPHVQTALICDCALYCILLLLFCVFVVFVLSECSLFYCLKCIVYRLICYFGVMNK